MYVIGVDFGTLSARALLVDTFSGKSAASAVFEYPHGVMDRCLPDGTPLPGDWALQHPQDYLDALGNVIPAVLEKSGIDPADVVGVGVDVTACTLLPVRADGTPLCFDPAFAGDRHAYVKLWKHHSASDEAARVTALAKARGEAFLPYYGGRVSPEWALPKIMETLSGSPEVYAAADRFIEAADWIVWMLTGRETRSVCCQGYKFLYAPESGYPDDGFFTALDARLADVKSKFGPEPLPVGARAGGLSAAAAELTGLSVGTSVAAGMIDAHVFVPAAGIASSGELLGIMGTSACYMLLSEKKAAVPGICGVVKDGILPGFYGYEAGQSSVGDCFQWMIDNALPQSYIKEAAEKGVGIHRLLGEKAAALAPGESGLLALDWFNGCRTPYVDGALSGGIVGLTLQTRPEEIYRALLEATAFGARAIVENYLSAGLAVDSLLASGGIAQKDPFLLQLYADVLGLPVRVAGGAEGGALGAAFYAFLAACPGEDLSAAVPKFGERSGSVYVPDSAHKAIYDLLYEEYRRLTAYFACGNDVMKRLKRISQERNSHV